MRVTSRQLGLRLVVVHQPGDTELVGAVGDDGTPAAVGRRKHLFAAVHQLGVAISQLFLAVTIEHQTGTVPALQPSLIALEVAAHKVNTAGLEVQVYHALALQLHLGITTEHPLVKRDRLLAILREIDVRYNICHSLSFSQVFPTEKPMGSSRDILPRHTKSGKQPKVATFAESGLSLPVLQNRLYVAALHSAYAILRQF